MDWQPIAAAPQDGTKIILWLADEGFPVMASWRVVPIEDEVPWEGFWIWEMDCGADMHHPTHWMKLPDPPA